MIGIGNIYWKEAKEIASAARLITSGSCLILATYFLITLLGALLDAVGVTALVNLVSGGRLDNATDFVTRGLYFFLEVARIEPSFQILVLFTLAVIAVRAVLVFVLQVIEGHINAFLRRRIQDSAFSNFIQGRWEVVSGLRVGASVGAITDEANLVSKYYLSIVRAVYYLLGALVLGGASLLVSAELSIVLAVAAVPIMLATSWLLSVQSKLSSQQTIARQAFSADVAERLQNIFQIKIDGMAQRHIETALRQQPTIAHLEIVLGYCQAGLAASKVLAPVLGLGVVYLWARLQGQDLSQVVHLFAGVGLLGLRAVNQVDNLVAMVGVISRVSGSLIPVHKLALTAQEQSRDLIQEQLTGVTVDGVTYRYRQGGGITQASLRARRGHPLVIRGASGAGKSTLANVIVGLLAPQEGRVLYEGASGATYCPTSHRVDIGYVAQDIQLFDGTIRDNLTSFGTYAVSDEQLWECLGLAGASEFVKKKGGLDARLHEGGGGLSGGEKRRLGIARALAPKPQMLVLDEVTSGLDPALKIEIMGTIDAVSKQLVTIVITHDPPMPTESAADTHFIAA